MEITQERIFAALVTAGAISQTTTGRYFWNGAAPVDRLKFVHADPVKYAQYLANDINIILADKPEEKQP